MSTKARLKAAGLSDQEIENILGSKSSGRAPAVESKKAADIAISDAGPSYAEQEQLTTQLKGAKPSAEGQAGQVATTAGAATANLYLLAAGLTLQTLGASSDRRQRDRELQAQVKLERIQRQQGAINKLMQLSQGPGL